MRSFYFVIHDIKQRKQLIKKNNLHIIRKCSSRKVMGYAAFFSVSAITQSFQSVNKFVNVCERNMNVCVLSLPSACVGSSLQATVLFGSDYFS